MGGSQSCFSAKKGDVVPNTMGKAGKPEEGKTKSKAFVPQSRVSSGPASGKTNSRALAQNVKNASAQSRADKTDEEGTNAESSGPNGRYASAEPRVCKSEEEKLNATASELNTRVAAEEPRGCTKEKDTPQMPAATRASTAKPKAADEGFETFLESFSVRSLPIVVFTDDVGEQLIWGRGSVQRGNVRKPGGAPDVRAREPVVMSPAYLGFAIEPCEPRYLHYRGVGMVFRRPAGGRFMQPSIDTVLVCLGLSILFAEAGREFCRAVDVGSGSGFIGKFVAARAPGKGELRVALSDIDPAAMEFARSPGFNALAVGLGNRAVSWELVAGDAVELLGRDAGYDLIVSNPPYIPTRQETQSVDSRRSAGNFWEGTGLLLFLFELLASGRCANRAHLVLAMTSLTLKSLAVRAAFEGAANSGVQIRVLVEREVAWKAWYAGPSSLSHLLASGGQSRCRTRLGENEFFIGATEDPRLIKRAPRNVGYHWHVAYVLAITRR